MRRMIIIAAAGDQVALVVFVACLSQERFSVTESTLS
jgi:hypothetical protein